MPPILADASTRLFTRLEQAVADRTFAGCVALVADGATVLYHEAHGTFASYQRADCVSPLIAQPLQRDAIFDLASLTKVLCTTTLLAQDVSAQRVDLAQEVEVGSGVTTIEQLLYHRSGLAAHLPFYASYDWASADVRQDILDRARRCELTPSKGETVYSDIGFLRLTSWLEAQHQKRIDALFVERIAAPLGLLADVPAQLGFLALDAEESQRQHKHYLDGSRRMPKEQLVAGEVYDRALYPNAVDLPDYFELRERFCEPEGWARGQVHDDNAFCMLGVAGHAGLFGNAAGVHELALAWLTPERLAISPAVRDQFWQRQDSGATARCLGFDAVDPAGKGSTGHALASDSVGHLGFTGCSVWIEPRAGAASRIYVLLSHRVHPTRGPSDKIRRLRRDFHHFASAL